MRNEADSLTRPLLLASLLVGLGCGDGAGDREGLGPDAGATEDSGEAVEATNDASSLADASGLDAEAVAADAGGDAGDRLPTDAGRDAGRDGGPSDAGGRDSGRQDAAADAGPAADASVRSGRSAGCGQAADGAGSFAMRSVRVAQRDRTYHVRLPNNYDPARAYPLIFRWHGYTGDGLSGGLDIEQAAGSAAIVVGADGLNAGWDDASQANDLALFDAMYDALSQRYCVDLGRVFSYGFSMGGGMSNLLSCERADKLRGVAAIAGYDRGQGTCTKPVAAWFLHDHDDDDVPVSEGWSARDRMLVRNDCSQAIMPTSDDCVRYQDCATGYPVVWCETNMLGHNIAGDTAPAEVWDFFRSLP